MRHGLLSSTRLSAFFLSAAFPFFGFTLYPQFVTIMESDSSEELVRALSLCRVPETLSAQIAQAYETPSDFAFAFPQLSDLNRLLEDIDEETKRAIGLEPEANILASLPASRLRKALKMCQDATMHGAAGTQPQLTPTPVRSLDSLTHSHEWVENLPPKLTTETVDSLVSTFKQNYPGELLDNDSMPSIRLLSLVHEGLKTRLKWIPWQYRLSQKQYQEILEAKTTKAVRSEVQLLTAAFMDDQPELSVESRPLSAGWLMQIQTIFRNALALCNAAHLKSLKDFDKKIADLCLKQPDRTSGLRTVTTQELLSADRRMWNTISDLLREGWSLDEALHEMTTVRSDIPSLLQWRPAQPRLPPALEQLFKGKGKGKGKLQLLLDEPPWKKLRTEDKPFKKTEKPQPNNIPKNWADKYQGKPICRRYQSGTCKTPGCKFAHVCAIKGCHKSHPAREHKDKQPNQT